jgi:hypothetical protein
MHGIHAVEVSSCKVSIITKMIVGLFVSQMFGVLWLQAHATPEILSEEQGLISLVP